MTENSYLELLSRQQLVDVLGYPISEAEFFTCLQQIQFLEPKVGLFWQAADAEIRIYIVLKGKVRLIDRAGELITTLVSRASFGECTLFPEAAFEFYSARAAINVKLCYLPSRLLFSLIRQHPQIRDHLYCQAQTRNNSLLNAGDSSPMGDGGSPDENFFSSPSMTEGFSPYTPHPTPNTLFQVRRRFANQKSQESPGESKPKSKINKAYFPHPTQQVGHLLQRIHRRYPFFAQQSTSDCGAACLVMVARYWGKYFSLNRLRDICNVDRNGASLRGISAAAESIGFSTRPVKASLEQFAQQKLPAIVHWQGKHFIVVYEVTPKQVIIADPAIGQRSLSPREFQASWTGYALLLQPTVLLKETRNDTTPFWQFFELVKPHSLVLLEVFIASVFIQIFGLITPIFTQLILDRVVVQRSTLTLTAVGLGLLIFSLFQVAMTGLRQYLLDHTANKVDLALILGFIRHTFRLPLSFFESRYVGDIVSRMQENSKIQNFLTGEALSILLDLLTVFIYVGLMFWYSWKMALLALAIVPPFFLLALIATPFLRRISREIFNAAVTEGSYLIEALSGVRTIKSMAVEQTVRWHWEEFLHKEIKTNFSGQVIGNRLQILSNTIEAVANVGLLWFGATLVIQNQLTIGQLVAFNMLLGNVISPFQRLTVLWDEFQEVAIAVERINDVLDVLPEEDLQHQVRQSLPILQGQICFERVTFRYHPESEM
ncbi:MAG: peptidase domain-containing ABC transporter [Calothrix sp. MO_167.B42]|nr:peptidase domain-containing ABC transporter [Calothrix sp. MO_167.B42]